MGIAYMDTRIYRYGEYYKIVYLKRYANSDYIFKEYKDDKQNGNKLLNNLCRAKSTVMQLGYCNNWELFSSFTLNKDKYDRYDLKKFQKDFTQYIRDLRKKTNKNIRYLLIPERHEDGAWHLHGLFMGLDWKSLEKFNPVIHPIKLVKKGYRYHVGITNKFGFCSFGKIKNKEAAVLYLLKYISKDMAKRTDELHAHLYYASLGLERPELVCEGASIFYHTKIDYQNEFFATGWVKPWQVEEIKQELL